jgi:hypothetical protein
MRLAATRVRLYSTEAFKRPRTLARHKQGCQAIPFACPACPSSGNAFFHRDLREVDKITIEKKHARALWLLVTGSADAKVSIRALMNFAKTSTWVCANQLMLSLTTRTPYHHVLRLLGSIECVKGLWIIRGRNFQSNNRPNLFIPLSRLTRT